MEIKKFTKEEFFIVCLIFFVLVAVSVPNFVASLRRARNQTRKDDMAYLKTSVESYREDFGSYPLSTEDGRFLACLAPGATVEIGKDGRLIADLVPCEWGRDAIADLTPGSTKVYIKQLPSDPRAEKGYRYAYLSDGSRFQIFSALEGKDDAEYDPGVVSRNVSCGSFICNLGRGYGCEPQKTLAVCEEEQLRQLQIKK